MKKALTALAALATGAAAFLAWFLNFYADVFLMIYGTIEMRRYQLILIAAVFVAIPAALLVLIRRKFPSLRKLSKALLCGGLCFIMAASIFGPVYLRTTLVRGVRGVDYFYRLYGNQSEWEVRRKALTDTTLDIFQLDLEKAKAAPTGKTAYAPRIYDEEAGIVIERFYVETIPGYYLCANIYASADPAVSESPMPLVMLAHGHFNRSFENRDRFFEDSQYLGAAFAQRGFIVAAWDMIGLGDDRNDANTSILPHADKNNTVLQTWNSMRLLSYLLSGRFTEETRYQIDERYVAVTGASGGGTQTIYMSMFDDRVTASIPVVMVSAYFNGDCKCENGINALRAGKFKTNITERIACFAPKPLLVISDGDDWTRRNPVTEYPYLRHVYAFYGAETRAENFHDLRGKHDYSLLKRQKALDFLLRQWNLPANGVFDAPYTEDRYTLKSADELRTFGALSGLERPGDYVKSIDTLTDYSHE
ncbi:MAG: hypothetical protein FWF05_06655 [Oscillospiraceae bacterium]|nr:hypothetical protein [Oscillospiraceae bacterium]